MAGEPILVTPREGRAGVGAATLLVVLASCAAGVPPVGEARSPGAEPAAGSPQASSPGDVEPAASTAAGGGVQAVASDTVTTHSSEAPPASVDMSPDSLARLDSVILAALADSASPGAALAVGRRGEVVRLRGYGTLDWDRRRPVTPTSMYDLASLTKVVGTTTAVMILEEEGWLELDAPVVRYLPWWEGPHPDKAEVTVRQLLLHRAGLAPFRRWFFELEGPEAYRRALAEEPLLHPAGSRTAYSDLGAITLGLVVEVVGGKPLDAFLEDRVFGPLGMEDTDFTPDIDLLPRIAPTELDTVWRHEHVHGVVHDENADAMGGVAGHAGLFSTAADLAVFARMMAGGGRVPPCRSVPGSGDACPATRPDPVRVLDASTIERYTRRHDSGSSRALGWDTPSGRSSAGAYFSTDAFGHTGFTGTSLWIDPELDLFVVLLTNRVNPTRGNVRHAALRRRVHDLVARSVTDREVERRDVERRDEGGR